MSYYGTLSRINFWRWLIFGQLVIVGNVVENMNLKSNLCFEMVSKSLQ